MVVAISCGYLNEVIKPSSYQEAKHYFLLPTIHFSDFRDPSNNYVKKTHIATATGKLAVIFGTI